MTDFRSAAPGASQTPPGSLLGELISRFAAMRGAAPSTTQTPAGDPGKVFREILQASFAADARGRRLRDGWRQVGEGLLLILREFSAAPHTDSEP